MRECYLESIGASRGLLVIRQTGAPELVFELLPSVIRRKFSTLIPALFLSLPVGSCRKTDLLLTGSEWARRASSLVDDHAAIRVHLVLVLIQEPERVLVLNDSIGGDIIGEGQIIPGRRIIDHYPALCSDQRRVFV